MIDALKATYADLKTVKSRSSLQVILEMPIEALPSVVSLLGAPIPGETVWVGLARLKLDAEGRTPVVEQLEDHRPAKPSKLAGILCNEGGFHTFLTENGHETHNAEEAAEHVRLICGGIASRRDLDTNTHAAALFNELRGKYQAWRLVA